MSKEYEWYYAGHRQIGQQPTGAQRGHLKMLWKGELVFDTG